MLAWKQYLKVIAIIFEITCNLYVFAKIINYPKQRILLLLQVHLLEIKKKRIRRSICAKARCFRKRPDQMKTRRVNNEEVSWYTNKVCTKVIHRWKTIYHPKINKGKNCSKYKDILAQKSKWKWLVYLEICRYSRFSSPAVSKHAEIYFILYSKMKNGKLLHLII